MDSQAVKKKELHPLLTISVFVVHFLAIHQFQDGKGRLSRQIIDLLKDHGELSISEIESITKANRNTLKKKLLELVKNKYLLTQGRGKGTRYIIGIK